MPGGVPPNPTTLQNVLMQQSIPAFNPATAGGVAPGTAQATAGGISAVPQGAAVPGAGPAMSLTPQCMFVIIFYHDY